MSKVLTTCPFCGCGCGALLEVENDRVLGVSPEKAHPMSRGTLCVKGWNGWQIIHNPNRLKSPMIKEGGKFKETSWSKALSVVADALNDVKKKHGTNAIGVVGSLKCTNEDHYVLGKFARDVLGTNNIDTSVRYYQAPTMNALVPVLGYGAATHSITDIENADVILVVGANAKAQNAKVGSYLLRAAKDGAAVILIDPREIEHSRFFTLQLKPRPGTDLTVINSIAHVLIERGWYDKSVEGVDAHKKSLAGDTPEHCEQTIGVPTNDLTQAAELLGKGKKVVILFSNGLTQQASGTANVRALANLAILIGNLGVEGAGLMPLNLASNMQGAMDMGLMPEFLPGHLQADGTEGLTLHEMVEEAGTTIRAMYVLGENLVWSAPDASATAEALKRLDFLVVQELFMTETAELADVVLPAASYAEKDGTFTSTERRVQRIRKAISPIGDSKPDWEIIRDLASKLGGSLNYKNPEDIFEEISSKVSPYKGLNYKLLDRPGGIQWPLNGNGGSSFLKKEQLAKGSGKFVPITRFALPSEQPDEEYPYTLIVGRHHFHRITGTLNTRSFTLNKEFADGIVEINTDDVRELGLRSGWKVKILTRRGEVTRTVVSTRGVPAKTIFVPIFHKDGLTNALTNAALEPESKIPEMKICAAKLESL